MHFSREDIANLKRTPIADYLSSLSIQPVKESNGQLLYHSPLTDEHSPSFYVHPGKNVFNCFSSGEKGDVIRLVILLEKIAFKPALERLATFDATQIAAFSFGSSTSNSIPPCPPEQSTTILLDDRALFNQVLMEYAMGRGIPASLAKRYLHEVRYKNDGRIYESVGFKTDKNSYALRSKGFKGWLGQSAIRTISVEGSTELDLFEGFFDFLSFLTYFLLLRPKRTTIVLNSTSNLKQALPALEGYKRINCFFDNDSAGRKAFDKLKALNLPVKNRSGIYIDSKDFNEFLITKNEIIKS